MKAPLRSLLFVPGHRPDMVAKVPRWQPDAVAIDLEDAVAASEKDAARATALEAAAALGRPGFAVLIRINPPDTPWFEPDLNAIVDGSGIDGVILPKFERTRQLDSVRAFLGRRVSVLVGIESALGVADSRTLLRAPGVAGAYFGAEDYVADVGGRRTVAGLEALYARSQVALAARLGGVPLLDQVVTAVGDDERFLADAREGRNLGYSGKICIHPGQVALAHRVYSPTDEEVAHAEQVLAAGGNGVATVDGAMVDEVHLKMARATLARRRS